MHFDGRPCTPGGAWDHGDHSGRHELFHLSCDEYFQLVAQANGRCPICDHVIPVQKLAIDHDHALSLRAVRGLLCDRCNIALGFVDNGSRLPTPREVAYLANPFHLRIPADRPPLREDAPIQWQASVGRFGGGRCPQCHRHINLDRSGNLRPHSSHYAVSCSGGGKTYGGNPFLITGAASGREAA